MNAPHNIPAVLLYDCPDCGYSPDECHCPVECTECDDGWVDDADGCRELRECCSCEAGQARLSRFADMELDNLSRRAGVWL